MPALYCLDYSLNQLVISNAETRMDHFVYQLIGVFSFPNLDEGSSPSGVALRLCGDGVNCAAK